MFRYFLPLLAAAALQAGIMDFQTIDDAKQAYADKQYEKAAKLYSTIADKNDEARFDYATSLYRSGKFKPALDEYGKIPDGSSLRARSLYNAGNAHAQLGELDRAEQAYTDALKAAKDEEMKKDVEHNLEVIRQEKERQKQQKNKDQDKQKQNDQNQQDKKNDQNQNGQDRDQKNDQKNSQSKDGEQNQDQNDKQQQNAQDQDNQQNRDEADKQNREGNEQDDQRRSPQEEQEQAQKEQQQSQNTSEPSEEEKQQGAGAEEKEKKDQQEQNGQQAQAAMAAPISDMEERKYNQMLERRGIKTLMIPLSGKGEAHENETTPW